MNSPRFNFYVDHVGIPSYERRLIRFEETRVQIKLNYEELVLKINFAPNKIMKGTEEARLRPMSETYFNF